MADIFSSEKRKELMSKVRNKNTDIELILRKELFRRGLRFRVNSKLTGKPDIVFPGRKLAIFCDGDFWHGKNYEKERVNYKPFWIEKIQTNMNRDKRVDGKLANEGWKVLRFWKTEILKDVGKCADSIENMLK